MNAALTKSLNKLRQEPLNTAPIKGQSTPLYAETLFNRPTTGRVISHKNITTMTTSNSYYPIAGATKGPLPAELLSKRPISSFTLNMPSTSSSQSRVSAGTGPFIIQQPPIPIHNEIKSTNSLNIHLSTPSHTQTKSLDAAVHQLDGINFNSRTAEQQPDKSRVNKTKNKKEF